MRKKEVVPIPSFIQEDALVWCKIFPPGAQTEDKSVYHYLPEMEYEDYNEDDDTRENFGTIEGPKEVKFENLMPRAEYEDNLQDLIDMKIFNEAEMMNIIKERYECDDIYTYCGTTLISVNPYALFEGEYNTEKKMEYIQHLNRPYFIMKSIPPHIYSVGVSALHEIKYSKEPDVRMNIVIDGEVGSGKTEAAIYLQDFIINYFNPSPQKDSIETKIMNGHTILSAFGNAKTALNDNSSRFGKCITLYLDASGSEKIIGYNTQMYMLEKDRIIHQRPEDRTFHIFYAILNHMTAEQKSKYHFLDNVTSYPCIAETAKLSSSTDDQKMLDDVLEAFQILNIGEETQDNIFRLLSLILAVSSIEYEDTELDDMSLRVIQTDATEKIQQLLNCDYKKMSDLFTFDAVQIVGDVTLQALKRQECLFKKEMIQKTLYNSLVHHLVCLQSDMTKIDKKTQFNTLSIIDMPGFEVFQENYLEQMMINYTSERFQYLFSQYFYKEEKSLFESEGLVKYMVENQSDSVEDIIRIIDNKKPDGVFQYLLSNTKLTKVGNGSAKFLTALNNNLKHNTLFNKKRLDRNKFTIKHSTGKIEYNTDFFIPNNQNEIVDDFYVFMRESNHPCYPLIEADMKLQKTRGVGLADEFTKKLGILISDLSKQKCKFVRCIKTNRSMKSETWVQNLVVTQLKQLGLEKFLAVKMKLYPIRIDYNNFCNQFLKLNGNCNTPFEMLENSNPEKQTNDSMSLTKSSLVLQKADFRQLSQQTMQFLFGVIQDTHILFGKQRIFIQSDKFTELEDKLKTYEAMHNKYKDWVNRCIQAYKFRTNWNGYVKDCQNIKARAKSIFFYLKFSTGLEVLERMQEDFKVKFVNRRRRIMVQKKTHRDNWVSTLVYRRKFILYRRSAIKIQRNYRKFKFLKKLRMIGAIRDILKEEYNSRFWKAILQRIENIAATKIQSLIRGFLARRRYAYEVGKIKEFKENYRENKAATKIQKFFKGNHVRLRLKKITKSSLLLQSCWRCRIHRNSYLELKRQTIKLQRFWRRYAFKIYKYDFLLKEKLDSGEYLDWTTTARKEMKYIHNANFVKSIKPSLRYTRFSKQHSNLSYVPDLKAFSTKKLKIYSYILDVDPVIDPEDTYQSPWAITFFYYLKKLRETSKGNFLGLSVGEAHSIAVGDNGKVYDWGNSQMFQLAKFEPLMNCTAKEMLENLEAGTMNYLQAGNNHNLLYSKTQKKLLSYGNNERGQLGLGHFNFMKGIIDLSHLTKGKSICSLEVRCDTNAFCTEDGTATVWPVVYGGRMKPDPFYFKPLKEKITSVGLGFDFVIYLSHVGKVYSMGATNNYGELGVGDFEPRTEPTLISTLCQSGDIITQVSCGFKHVIVKNQSGKIYTWGWGERGQLGHETDRNLPFPRKVLFKKNSGFSYHAVNIQAGYRSSYALVEGRRIFHWGTNGNITKQMQPIEYQDNGQDEIYYQKNDFKPIKIVTTWSKALSVTYVVLGDVRYLEDLKHSMKELLVNNIYEDWEKNYLDMKPEFDSRVEPYLDQNMKQNLEKIRKIAKATETRELRHKKIGLLKEQRSNTKEKLMARLSQEKQGISQKKSAKSKDKTGKASRNKENSNTMNGYDDDLNPNQKTIKKQNKKDSEILELKAVQVFGFLCPYLDRKLKLEKIKYHMKVILSKEPETWTDEDVKFLEEAKRTFKEYQREIQSFS